MCGLLFYIGKKIIFWIICDSTFIKTVFSSDLNNIIKDQNPFVKRQLVSLAYLDNNYNLSI